MRINGVKLTTWEIVQWEEAEKTKKPVKMGKLTLKKIAYILFTAFLGHR